ncbi:DNA (cytosine-5)-methyltransferase PliMCI-like [Adelges cooleyi]|uniref:DNA (cytosine-5)-methyltransferase PliMCI-like n=1 Tax=Adelges cooleyi TaxID=133065 RepID=UPI002180627C|nr:DNA (cytosine-5)-methyltransferase PliMCI-like [Adelges cooleyi]
MAPGTSTDAEPLSIPREFGIKRENSEAPEQDEKKFKAPPIVEEPIVKPTVRCKYCYKTQTESAIMPPNAEPECIVLTNDTLANIYTDNFDFIQHNLTDFSIYDENGHMCSIDTGMMERNMALYLTGYVKPVYDHSPSIEEGIPAKELGPILEWWLSSYDGGDKALIGVSTDYADYLLIEPHPKYKKYMTSVTEKIHLSKLVIESILNNSESDDPTYEDILNCIVNSVNPATGNNFTEEDLIAHAQFVLDQVTEYDSNDTYYLPLAETQCIDTLTQLSGAAKPVKAPSRRLERGGHRTRGVKTDVAKREFSKATTTELVKEVFENMFAAQLDGEDKENDATVNCNKLIKNVIEDACNVKIKTDEESDVDDINNSQVMWKNKKLREMMFVVVKNTDLAVPLIGRIEYFYKTNFKDKAHISLFMHSYETVLGETSDPHEIFALKKCKNIEINNIDSILNVHQKLPSDNWFKLGGSKLEDLMEPVNRNDKQSFFYQLCYDNELGRFEYPGCYLNIEEMKLSENYCRNCDNEKVEKKSQMPVLLEFIEQDSKILYYYKIKYKREEYKIGNFIYLEPDIFLKAKRANFVDKKRFVHRDSNKNKSPQGLRKVDEDEYPEYYRKTLENTMRGSNENTPDPFEIAEILAIYTLDNDKKNARLIVRRMYRSEKIPIEDFAKNTDMNLLLWSEEEFRVTHENICGKCYVAYINNIQEPLTWTAKGPDRFYFKNKYDFLTDTVVPDHELPCSARLTGKEVYVNYNYKYVDEDKIQYIPSYPKVEPLRGLDIFAGCGGLSRGLEDSGLVKSNWAIECDDKAAAAFGLNNPESTVFVEDCNYLLKQAMAGNLTNEKNQRIPQRGEVDFICGGPPCQGFSGMNRFNSGQYSLFKNSLIVSFLSYIDFYRPKFFVMENVRNFVSFKRSMVLKLTLRCITRMGYQCTFGILQAGNFGVPQTRRRLIILAAAPGEKLPLYPEPKHVFNRRGSSLSIQIGDHKFRTNCKYDESAPMRTVTVYDAWSDLPEINNGAFNERITYKSRPLTHMQKLLRFPNHRFSESVLIDHICKDMSPLVQARMELIPLGEGSDWRDLPNIEVKLSDGTMTTKLLYTHNDIKNGKGKNGALRGVCPCASGDKCNPQDRQNNTIIPWCLPHTGNRHNNWAGLYGRLAWTGFCSTTITNPEPMGKQGRVLHPEQHRVVSVRECARSQGFKDSYIFYGPIVNKHRQIGNAVPPPMGTAIGYEIIKAMTQKPTTKVVTYVRKTEKEEHIEIVVKKL